MALSSNKKRKLEKVSEEASSSSSSSEEDQIQWQESESEEEEQEKSDGEEEEMEMEKEESEEEEVEEKEKEKEKKQQDERGSDTEEESLAVAAEAEQDISESGEECTPTERKTGNYSDSSESEEEQEVQEVQEHQVSSSDSESEEEQQEEKAESIAESEEGQEEERTESVVEIDEVQEDEESEEKQEDKPRVPVKVHAPRVPKTMQSPTEEPRKKKQKMTNEHQKKEEKSVEEEELGEDEVRMHTVRRILQPLSFAQLVEIVACAAVNHDALYADLKNAIGPTLLHRKVNVSNLAVDTKSNKLKKAFKAFGEIERAIVITDKMSGKSRGFGYVTFTEVESAVRVIAKKSIVIDGRKVLCRLGFVIKDVGSPHQLLLEEKRAKYAKFDEETKDRRLFAFGLLPDMTEETLLKEFKKYGKVKVKIVRDHFTKKCKGYAFLTYREKAGADAALETPKKIIDGCTITCQLSSRNKMYKGHNGPNGRSSPMPFP